MKKIILLSLIFSMIIVSSCSESFIEKEPPLAVTGGDIFGNPSRIEANVLGLYGTLKGNAGGSVLLGGKMMVAFDNRSEDMINISNNIVTLYATYLMTTGDSDTECATYWSLAYRCINNVNTFLERIEEARDVVGDRYNQYIAEAKFVRAMAYYYLCMMYSKPYNVNPNAVAVPLRVRAEIDNSGNDLACSTISEIFAFILDDVSDASINALPVTTAPSYNAVIRASKGAALMLRMRVKMAMNNWDGAITDGNAITGYSLTESVKAPFTTPYYTSENIYSMPMATNNAPGTQYSYLEYYHSSPVIMIFNMDPPGILSEAAYNQEDDARIASFVERNGTNFWLAKYTTALKLDWVPIFRYAETLLNLAECYAAKGGSSEADAIRLLLEVRRRAITEDDDMLKDAQFEALTGDDLKQAIYKERRLEFLGEGIRGIDIVRRGESFPAKGSGAQSTLEVKPTDSNYMWPIPSTEKNSNSLIN